jgi:hypothetical protein
MNGYETFLQVVIVVTGGAAIALVGSGERTKRMGGWVGLAGQPAWFASTLMAGQWGMFVLSLWFAFWYAWIALAPSSFGAPQRAGER